MQKTGKIIRTIFTSGTAFILNCLISLLLTPFITKSVGTDAYGFVSLANNFTQYASLITIALNSFAARYIVISHHNNEKEKSNIYYSSTFFGDLILGTGILAVFLIGTTFIERILNVPENILTDVKLLFAISGVSFWVTTVFTVFESSAYVVNKLDLVGFFKGLSYVAECIVLVFCYMIFPAKIYYVGCGVLGANIVIALSNYWISRKWTPDLKIKRKYYRQSAVKRLVGSGVWASINSLGSLLNNGLDLLVCNLLLTPLDMGEIAIAKTIHAIFNGVQAVIGQAFHPVFLKDYAEIEKEDGKEKLLKDMKFSMKVSGLFSNILFAGFFALGLYFYKLWIPEQNILLVYQLTVINNLTAIPCGPMQPLYYTYTLTLKNRIPTIITLIGGAINVIGMYVLISYTGLGSYAVVLTTAVVMCVINFITNPLYIAHVLNLPKATFYPEIVRNLVSVSAMTIAFSLLAGRLSPNSWIVLIISAIGLLLVGFVLHIYTVFTKEERRKIHSTIILKIKEKKI